MPLEVCPECRERREGSSRARCRLATVHRGGSNWRLDAHEDLIGTDVGWRHHREQAPGHSCEYGEPLLRDVFLDRPCTYLSQPAKPVLKVPCVRNAAILDVVELVQRHTKRFAGRGDAKPFLSVGAR